MKEVETLGLIVMLYDYNPTNTGISIDAKGETQVVSIIPLVSKVNEYLTRRGYFNKRTGQPTLKFYKLLYKYGVHIDQLKVWQEEYETTKHITQIDK